METVPRLYRAARPGSRYDRSLGLLAEAAGRRDAGEYRGVVKTGIMLGLGETPEEVRQHAARHPRRGRRDPDPRPVPPAHAASHLPVDRWVHPDEFAAYRDEALALGFRHCEAGPLVRSSYHAHEHVPPPADSRAAGGAA